MILTRCKLKLSNYKLNKKEKLFGVNTGIILNSNCSCGFKQELWVDRGKKVKGPTCYAPALCPSCKKIYALNYVEKKVKCPDCGGEITFYNEKSLRTPFKDVELIKWGMDLKKDFELPKALFKCPQCGQMALKFQRGGFWD